VLEFALDAQRGSFHLGVECRFTAEWTVIFGPSGAGKSTLLRLLAGLDRPDRGHIALKGETLTDASRGIFIRPGYRKMSLVAQQSALFPHLTVNANVAYGLSGIGGNQRASRVAEVLRLVGAENLAQRRPHDLSGGEAQRVALARALAPLPRLLLLDEPFAALDGVASDALLARLQDWLKEHGVQTILVTHDAADAYAAGAEVALLREGQVVALGPPAIALAAERARIMERLKSS
jgi:ABC-type sulfate/molybdate transport systems ATPase subunit